MDGGRRPLPYLAKRVRAPWHLGSPWDWGSGTGTEREILGLPQHKGMGGGGRGSLIQFAKGNVKCESPGITVRQGL